MAGTCHVRLTALCLIIVHMLWGSRVLPRSTLVLQFRRRRAPSLTKAETSMFKRRDVICLLARMHTDSQNHARVRSCRADGHVNPHVSLEAQGKGKCKCSPLQVCDMPSSGRRAFAREHVEEREKRGIQGGKWRPFTNHSCPQLLFFSLFRWLLCCNRGWKHLRRMWQQFPFLLPSFLWYSVTRQMLHSTPPPRLSPSFVILISQSHVAPPASSGCRVRAGFAEAPACWQHTVTDPIAERRKPTEPQCKSPFAETCNVAIWV